MGRLFSFALGTLGLVLSLATFGCSHESPAHPSDGGTDKSTAMDVRTDADTDGPVDVIIGGGVDAAVDQPPKTDIRLILSEKAVKLTEGSTALTGTFTVTLSQTSPNPFIVTVLTGNPNVATVVPETLEFAANEIGPKEVTVIPATDDDTVDNTTVVTLSSPETGSASVSVDVKDSDVQTLIVPAKIAMTEGRTESLSVRLFKRPASSVVVTLTSSTPNKLSLGTTSMTFNAQNYSIPQTATLTAAQDDDTNLDNVTVNLTATGNVSGTSVAVEITDDDAVNMDISPATLTLMERGPTPGTIMVRLTRPPSADVMVAMASSNALKATVSPATLTFTTANYATAQSVQVSPVPDDDSRDEMVNMTFSATGISPPPPTRTVAVLIDDPDSQALQVTPTMVSVEEGETTAFDVRLTLNPGTSSTVAVFSQNPAKVEVSPPFLTFTTGNFSTPQTVTVKSLNDEDLANDSVMVTLTGAAADNVSVPVAVTDDDMQRIVLNGPLPGADVAMQETQKNGPPSTTQVGVRLAYRPPAPVTVLLTSGNGSKLELSRSTLTFSPSTYADVQLVQLTAPHDDDMVDDVIELSAQATSAGAPIPLAKLAVKIRDVDLLGFFVSKAVLGLVEGGTAYDKRPGGPNTVEAPETFKLTLTVIPEHDITAVIEAAPAQASKVEITPATCVLAGQPSLSAGCNISVVAREDQDVKDEVVTLTIRDQANVLAPATVNVAIDDKDVQSLQVTSSEAGFPNLVIAEGQAKEVKVALTAEPSEASSLLLTMSLANQVDLATSSPCSLGADGLLSTTGTWQAGCTVRIDARADKDLLEQNLSLRVNALGLGIADVFVNIKKTDGDKQAVVLTRCNAPATARLSDADLMAAFPVTEGSATLSQVFCVALAFQPDVTNTVTLTPSQIPIPLGPVVPNFKVTPSTLTFDAMTYDTRQPITITALADDNIDEESGQVIVSVTPFADPRTLRFSILDVDHQGILLGNELVLPPTLPPAEPKTLTLHERTQGAPTVPTSATMAIKLNRIPAKMMPSDAGSTETVTVRSPSAAVTVTGDCTGAPTSVTFTFTNVTWNTEQMLTLATCPDSDTHGGTVTVTVKSDQLATTPPRTIEITVDDEDQPYAVGVTVVGNGGSVSSATTPTDAKNHEISSCRAGSSSASCQGTFEPHSTVRLTETPDPNWEFDGWSCAPVGGGSPTVSTSPFLNVNMLSKPYQCTATFKPQLQVSVVGSGRVDAMAPSSGIDNCRSSGGDCTESYDVGTSIKLTAAPSSGWEFSGWSGCVAAPPVTDNPLTVAMSAPRSCTATFTEIVTP